MRMFLEEGVRTFRPRVARVCLDVPTRALREVSVESAPWAHEDQDLDGMGTLSGSALGLCLFLGAARAGERGPGLVIAVGSAVRRGLPTASRAAVAGISPLTGLYAESQVGGGLGAALAVVADALVIEGRLEGQKGAVLVLNGSETAKIELIPALDDLALPERSAHLAGLFPGASGLCIGRAGVAGVPFASLASLGQPPSFTGRGGLGALLGATGLVAVVVNCAPIQPEAPPAPWAAGLANSPHLRARGLGGTLELHDAFAARGDLPANPDLRAGLSNTLAARQTCQGCPTACRHVLQLGERKMAGRFSALHPLGERLGLRTAQDQLRLLEACNGVGVDAGEMGATLELAMKRQGHTGCAPMVGDVESLVAEVWAVGSGPLAAGSQGFAQRTGLDDSTRTVRGSAVRSVSDLAALLGQCVSVRGNDPMRVFPFLAENGGDQGRLARLMAPLDLPPGTFNSKQPAGKGRLVWWHENLANVVDASGFCAFSAAGLLGDGFGNLDDLAGWLQLPGLHPSGEALQAAGAGLVILQRELGERLGEEAGADLPGWAEASLGASGMWDEYRLLRGLDDLGRVEPWARGAVGTLALLEGGRARLPALVPQRVAPREETERQPGQLTLTASGPLGAEMGQTVEFACSLPVSVGALLRELAQEFEPAADWLWRAGQSAVCVYRETERLAPHDTVFDGDRLDLVVAISGG